MRKDTLAEQVALRAEEESAKAPFAVVVGSTRDGFSVWSYGTNWGSSTKGTIDSWTRDRHVPRGEFADSDDANSFANLLNNLDLVRRRLEVERQEAAATR